MLPRRIALTALGAVLLSFGAASAAEPQPKFAASRILQVTVYPNSALVTREVDVPEGAGNVEVVVSPLPPQTVNSSLYSEGGDGIRILTTRYRMRPVQEDVREEVRQVEAKVRELQFAAQKLQSDAAVLEKNVAMLAKLEDFTATSLKNLTEKGTLNADSIILLSKYVMKSRAERAQSLVGIQQQLQDNRERLQFAVRKLQDLSAGSSKIERDAVVVVDKSNAAAGKVRLNYLVGAASWHPQYKLRADVEEKKAVAVEYLAAVMQQSGEDWTGVKVSLSTAQPMLSAVPPDLKMLEVAVMPRGANNPANPMLGAKDSLDSRAIMALNQKAMGLRSQAQQSYTIQTTNTVGDRFINDAAALEQTNDLLAAVDEFKKNREVQRSLRGGEGPSITYELASRLSIPSRSDEQVVEITKIEMAPQYYYKAVPVLTAHVYRLADLVNSSKYVLLPGEATTYVGSDFVGRAELPLVAIGEQFTAGFGVDPQLQVQRQLLDKNRAPQGDNQVWRYSYRILISSYKAEPVKVQLWDRLPHGETDAVGVNVEKTTPSLSTDPIYVRESKPNHLLRWDLTAEPGKNGEKALAVHYEFKLELGRQMTIGNILAK